MTIPTDPGPEVAPDGHTWLSQEYCTTQKMWAPPDPTDIPPEWPAWQLPQWYADRTGMVQIPGQPGQPGAYQYVWSGWLPWQSFTDRYDPATEWPEAVRLTAGDMQAALWPPAPADPAAEPTDVPLIALTDDAPDGAPPLSDPTLGQELAAPEGN